MTEFKIEPIRQMIIHDLIHEEIENFLHHCYADSQVSKIWVDGIIIDYTPLGFGETTQKESMKGIKRYSKLVFVKYQKYAQTVKWNVCNYELVLRNYNNNPRFRALAKWIKSQPVWKTIPEKIVCSDENRLSKYLEKST